MTRSTIAKESRVPFFAHADEFQSFVTDAFASLTSDARKYRAHFCLSQQFTDQIAPMSARQCLAMPGRLSFSVLAGTDAKLLAPEFHPIEANALADQLPFSAWLRRVRAFPATSRSKARRQRGSRAAALRLCLRSRMNFGRNGAFKHDSRP
jgi:hypothetical protein